MSNKYLPRFQSCAFHSIFCKIYYKTSLLLNQFVQHYNGVFLQDEQIEKRRCQDPRKCKAKLSILDVCGDRGYASWILNFLALLLPQKIILRASIFLSTLQNQSSQGHKVLKVTSLPEKHSSCRNSLWESWRENVYIWMVSPFCLLEIWLILNGIFCKAVDCQIIIFTEISWWSPILFEMVIRNSIQGTVSENSLLYLTIGNNARSM